MVLLMPWLVKTISKSDCIACDSRVPRDIGQSIRHKDLIFEACNYVQSVFDVYNVYDDESHWPINTLTSAQPPPPWALSWPQTNCTGHTASHIHHRHHHRHHHQEHHWCWFLTGTVRRCVRPLTNQLAVNEIPAEQFFVRSTHFSWRQKDSLSSYLSHWVFGVDSKYRNSLLGAIRGIWRKGVIDFQIGPMCSKHQGHKRSRPRLLLSTSTNTYFK